MTNLAFMVDGGRAAKVRVVVRLLQDAQCFVARHGTGA